MKEPDSSKTHAPRALTGFARSGRKNRLSTPKCWSRPRSSSTAKPSCVWQGADKRKAGERGIEHTLGPICDSLNSVAADDFLKSFQIDVETYKGTVQLSGLVHSQQAVDKAGQIARSVKGVKSIDCALFDSPDGFPIEFLRYATSMMAIEIRDTQARCDFVAIPPGTYALAVIHDENRNGKLDTDWLGIPTEGYGFSNDAKAMLGAPSFSAARFPYNRGILDLTISLHY